MNGHAKMMNECSAQNNIPCDFFSVVVVVFLYVVAPVPCTVCVCCLLRLISALCGLQCPSDHND